MKKFSKEHRANLSKALRGRKITWGDKIAKARKGITVTETTAEKHWNWKGDKKISERGIHRWIAKRITKPTHCTLCNKEGRVELSNKDHKYSRNPKDYQYLCRSCHRKYDIAHNGFNNHTKMNPWGKKLPLDIKNPI